MEHHHSSRLGLRRNSSRAALTAMMVGSWLVAPWLVSGVSAADGDLRLLLDDSVSTSSASVTAISGDGRFVMVQTSARLIADDTGNVEDVYVVDTADGTIQRASVRGDGTQANNSSFGGVLSADGRFVAFTSVASNLTPGDDNNGWDVFVKDLATGAVSLASRSPAGGPGAGSSQEPQISADGRYVVFLTEASDIVPEDTNGSSDVVVYDRSTGENQLVSRDLDGLPAGDSYGASIDGAGRLVSYYSLASDIVSGDTNGYSDVFVRDLVSGLTTRVSLTSGGGQANSWSDRSRLSGNGRYVAFRSGATNLADGDGNTEDIFVHDRRDGSVERISSTPDGREASGDSPSISWGGRFVAFHSYSTELVGGEDFSRDAFVFDRASGRMTAISYPRHAGAYTGLNAGLEPVISADGGTVAFNSEEDLTAEDTDFNLDAYLYDNGDVDDQSPVVVLDEAPASPTSDTTPTFGFVSETGVSFECSLEPGGEPVYQACTSPYTSDPLPDGDHLFRVRAVDEQGRRGDAVTHAFTVDTTPPVVVLDEAPPTRTSDDTPTFAFSGESGATYQCRISLGVGPWRPCTSPVSYGPLAEGSYTFAVQAIDAAGNAGPVVTHTFTIGPEVDVPVPAVPDLAAMSDTGLSSTDNVTSDTTPTFAGTAATGTTVAIRIDGVSRGSASVTASGTYTVTTSALPLGVRQVTAVATDGDGNASAASGALAVEVVAATACHTATNVITGTAANNTLDGARLADKISGLGGNDTINGRANGDCVLGGNGTDDLAGAAGNDELLGEAGNDKLALGAGTDLGWGGAGNDRISARDGIADRIDCGTGTRDVAIVDANDVVVNCETVRVG